MNMLRPTLTTFAALTVVTGLAYPLALTGLGNLAGFACFALALGWLQASQGASPATVFSQAALPLLAALLAGLVLGVLTLHLSKWLGYRQYVARQALLLGGLTLLTGLGGELALLPALLLLQAEAEAVLELLVPERVPASICPVNSPPSSMTTLP